MNQTRNGTLGSLLPSVGAAVALLVIGGAAFARAQEPWLGVSSIQPEASASENPTEAADDSPRPDAGAEPRAAKVHGTITVDFEKVTIAELLRLTKTLEQVDGVIHIVAAGGGDGDDRAVVTITRPGSPALILGEEGAARDQAQRLAASTAPRPAAPAPPAATPAPDRPTTSAFPRLASLGRRLGLQTHHHHQTAPAPRFAPPPPPTPTPTTVTWEPRRAAPGSDEGLMRASGDAPAIAPAPAQVPMPEPAPGELEIGARLDALSAGRPLSCLSTTSAASPRGQAQATDSTRRRIATADDSFESLSQAFYGDARYARALWWANRSEVAWPGALTEGKRIVIPAPGELEPRMIVSPDPVGVALSPKSEPKAEPSNPPRDPGIRLASFEQPAEETAKSQDQHQGGFSIHVVRPDDTLRLIAREICGDERKALEIIALNRDILTPEGRIRVGQRLLMPAADQP